MVVAVVGFKCTFIDIGTVYFVVVVVWDVVVQEVVWDVHIDGVAVVVVGFKCIFIDVGTVYFVVDVVWVVVI